MAAWPMFESMAKHVPEPYVSPPNCVHTVYPKPQTLDPKPLALDTSKTLDLKTQFPEFFQLDCPVGLRLREPTSPEP